MWEGVQTAGQYCIVLYCILYFVFVTQISCLPRPRLSLVRRCTDGRRQQSAASCTPIDSAARCALLTPFLYTDKVYLSQLLNCICLQKRQICLVALVYHLHHVTTSSDFGFCWLLWSVIPCPSRYHHHLSDFMSKTVNSAIGDFYLMTYCASEPWFLVFVISFTTDANSCIDHMYQRCWLNTRYHGPLSKSANRPKRSFNTVQSSTRHCDLSGFIRRQSSFLCFLLSSSPFSLMTISWEIGHWLVMKGEQACACVVHVILWWHCELSGFIQWQSPFLCFLLPSMTISWEHGHWLVMKGEQACACVVHVILWWQEMKILWWQWFQMKGKLVL